MVNPKIKSKKDIFNYHNKNTAPENKDDRQRDNRPNITEGEFVIKTEANQVLLDKQVHRYSAFQIDGSTQKREEQSSQAQNQIEENEEKCYPKCLGWIGQCITPCLACCPCCRFDCCCQNLPLFQQPVYSFGILQKWGSYEKLLNPGLNVINPISQKIIQINKQTKTIQISQIAFSKDNVQFKVDSIIFYRIIDSLKLAYKLGTTQEQCRQCVSQIAQACLRNIIGLNTLQAVIEKRDIIGKNLREDLNKNLQIWGIYVEVCNLKEIVLSLQIRQYLQSAAKAKRLMQAQIINYKAQVQIGKLIKQMSQILSTKAAFQIRYLDTIGTILQTNQNSIIMLRTDIDEGTKSVSVNPVNFIRKIAE